MKKIATVFGIVLFFTTLSFSQELTHQPKKIGLGVVLGEPTGFSGKVNIDSKWAVDFAAAWAFSGEDAFHIHADVLNHARSLFHIESAYFDLHYGVGFRSKFNDRSDDNFGIRFPVGVDYTFQKVPIELFVEIAGILDFVPDTDFALNGGIGARFYF